MDRSARKTVQPETSDQRAMRFARQNVVGEHAWDQLEEAGVVKPGHDARELYLREFERAGRKMNVTYGRP